MLRFFLLLSLLSGFFVAGSQALFDRHPAMLGINVLLFNYGRMSSLSGSHTYDPGISAVYLKGLNKHFDIQISLDGSFPDSIAKNERAISGLLQVQSTIAGRYRLFSPIKSIQPYLLFGVGLSHRNEKSRPFVLIGPGAELRYKSIYFLLSAQFRTALNNDLANHYYYSLGISGLLKKPKNKKQSVAAPLAKLIPSRPLKDQDNDGTLDSLDYCPDIPGPSSLFGCPDSDGDGISDKIDLCPKIFGYKEFGGCPFADFDKDGIRDESDSCPQVPGIEKYRGCPPPDSDKDGVIDEEDSCVSEPGPKTNNGCPVITQEITDKINLAASQIYFKSGSHELLSKSFQSLDEIVAVLKKHPTLTLSLEGHTDNIGSEKDNKILSQNRANAVVDYLINQGIGPRRLQALGYGMLKPIADNNTQEGRSRNRRVEIKLFSRF